MVQTDQPVTVGDAAERRHHQLLVVGGDVALLVDGSQLVLAGCHLVVSGFGGDAQLEHLPLGVQHEGEHPLWDGAEVVVVELLALGRLGAHQGSTGGHQVGPGEVEVAVDQEVLLFGAGDGRHPRGVLDAEEAQHALGLHVECLLGTQHRGLLVERFAGPGHERRRDAQRVAVGVFEDVGRAGDVPGGVAAGLEGLPDAAAGKRRRIGLALDQRAAGEVGDRQPGAVGIEKAVVLLGAQTGEGVKDVGVVAGAVLGGPVLHRRGDDVGDRRVEADALVDGGLERLVDRLGQPALHDRFGEHVAAEQLGGCLDARSGMDRARTAGRGC